MRLPFKIRSKYGEFKRIQQRDGTAQAVKLAASYAVTNPTDAILLRDHNYQTDTRVDLEDRWDIIEDHLDPESRNVLDIGCAQGELTKRVAETGRFALGMERSATTVESNNRKYADVENLHFINCEIDPDLSITLPSFDTVFLLTVYYHLGREYGWAKSESILREIGGNSGQIFFETPKTDNHIKSDLFRTIEADSLKNHHQQYLQKVFNNKSTVEHIGTVDYTGNERDDLLFKIDSH